MVHDRLSAYFESFGCQMNAFDTEVIESILAGRGFVTTTEPHAADVIILNTCSVRDHAEQRAIGRLHDLSRYGDATLVVCGCMAQRLGDVLRDKVPDIDIIAGPGTYNDLPTAILKHRSEGSGSTMLDNNDTAIYGLPKMPNGSPSRYLSITRGCENYCSYCIVPYVRGPVRSKPVMEIIDELHLLEASGAREVTLLGQNVMAYRGDCGGFVELMRLILDETSLSRIRFLTTHPRNLDLRLFKMMSDEKRLCPHLHLPLQAGSDRILLRMNRGYTVSQYLSLVETAREVVPGIALSTDIIVGFPGEGPDDFQQTMDVVDLVRFESAFTFRYSVREGTAAARLEDDVSDSEKRSRLEQLNLVLRRIRRELLLTLVGTREEILLDGCVKKGEYTLLKGRTPHFRNVLVEPAGLQVGDIATVTLRELRNYTFFGDAVPRR